MPHELVQYPSGFFVGVATAGLLLLAGVCLGLWLARRSLARPHGRVQGEQLNRLASGLFRFTHGFADDVSQHRSLLDDIATRYAGGQPVDSHTPATTLEFYAQMVSANEQLKQRIAQAEQALKHQANEISTYLSEARTDALTGLPNRRAFDDELARRFAEWKRYGTPVSVLLVDVDRFKTINDGHGHLAGDAVLAQVARRLLSTMRDSDLVARFGGEEFAMILPATLGADAFGAAERARQAAEQAAFPYESHALRVTVSCGAAQVLDDENPAGVIKRADAALYASKNAGRNCAHLHDGKQCLQLPQTASPQPPQEEDTGSAGNLRQACVDLRQRLLEVAQLEANAR